MQEVWRKVERAVEFKSMLLLVQVSLVQAENFAWFGYPDDPEPSARNFLPGLAKAGISHSSHGNEFWRCDPLRLFVMVTSVACHGWGISFMGSEPGRSLALQQRRVLVQSSLLPESLASCLRAWSQTFKNICSRLGRAAWAAGSLWAAWQRGWPPRWPRLKRGRAWRHPRSLHSTSDQL